MCADETYIIIAQPIAKTTYFSNFTNQKLKKDYFLSSYDKHNTLLPVNKSQEFSH